MEANMEPLCRWAMCRSSLAVARRDYQTLPGFQKSDASDPILTHRC